MRKRLAVVFTAMAFVISCAVFPSLCAASLAGGSQLANLIEDSDLIVQGMVWEIGFEEPLGRHIQYAKLHIDRVFKGVYGSDMITIRFKPEIHDQLISELGFGRVLFLKKTEHGEYEGTYYGKSYWLLKWDGQKLLVPYVGRILLIDVPDHLLKEAEIVPSPGFDKQRVKVIYLEDLVSLLENHGNTGTTATPPI